MNIIYESKTGNVKRFCDKLAASGLPVYPLEEAPDGKFVLITYTTLMGSTPLKTDQFMSQRHSDCLGVAVSGNRNWGDLFAKTADNLHGMYGTPVLHKFELSGLKSDVEKIINEVKRIADISPEVD